MTTKTTKDTVVWVGELHYADCDPLVHVVAMTKDALLAQLDASAQSEWLNDDDEDAELDLRQTECRWTLAQLRLDDEQTHELLTEGVVVL